MARLASTFLKAAASQIGYREGQDPDGNWNNDNKFGVWYGMNRVAWCAIFVSWCADQAGALGTLVPKYASCSYGLQWFRDRGQTEVWPPKPGDIFILRDYSGGAWRTVHTGMVEKWEPDTSLSDAGAIVTIEGNTNDNGSAQGNGVYRLRRRDSKSNQAIVYCRPKWDPEPAPAPAPTPTPVVKPAPAPYILPASQRAIKTSDVRPDNHNESCRRFNALLWAKMPQAYRNANYAAWMKEAGNFYGPQAQKACLELYRIVAKANHAYWGDPPSAPAWPGDKLVRYVGGNPY